MIGAPYAGFGAPGVDCNDADGWAFTNNIAHSNDGDGAIFFPDSDRPQQ